MRTQPAHDGRFPRPVLTSSWFIRQWMEHLLLVRHNRPFCWSRLEKAVTRLTRADGMLRPSVPHHGKVVYGGSTVPTSEIMDVPEGLSGLEALLPPKYIHSDAAIWLVYNSWTSTKQSCKTMTCRAEQKTEFQGLSSFGISPQRLCVFPQPNPRACQCGREAGVLVTLCSAHHPSHHVTRAVRKRRMRKNWEEGQPQARAISDMRNNAML